MHRDDSASILYLRHGPNGNSGGRSGAARLAQRDGRAAHGETEGLCGRLL